MCQFFYSKATIEPKNTLKKRYFQAIARELPVFMRELHVLPVCFKLFINNKASSKINLGAGFLVRNPIVPMPLTFPPLLLTNKQAVFPEVSGNTACS
jgi:hypothetical protein